MRLAGLIDGLGVQFAAHTGVLDRDRLLHHVRTVAAGEVGLSVTDFGEAAASAPVIVTAAPSLETEAALRRLVESLCDALIRRDAEAAASSWTDDGTWQSAGVSERGRAAIAALVTRRLDASTWSVATAPQMVFEVDGPARASGRVVLDEREGRPDGSVVHRVSVATDEYVRTAAGWQFAARSIDVVDERSTHA